MFVNGPGFASQQCEGLRHADAYPAPNCALACAIDTGEQPWREWLFFAAQKILMLWRQKTAPALRILTRRFAPTLRQTQGRLSPVGGEVLQGQAGTNDRRPVARRDYSAEKMSAGNSRPFRSPSTTRPMRVRSKKVLASSITCSLVTASMSRCNSSTGMSRRK